MTQMDTSKNCERFYRLRDQRTETYVGRPWHPMRTVRIAIDAAAAASQIGQHLTLSLINLLARVHRRILFTLPEEPTALRAFSIVPTDTFQDAVLNTARAIDPCGSFKRATVGGDTTFGIGLGAEAGLDWYLGADRAIAYLQQIPTPLNTNSPGSMRGAGLAACLGAAAAFKTELGLRTAPRVISAWNYMENEEGDPGPEDLEPLRVGHVLMVGGGAVASGLVYWLLSWGVEGEWTVVDRDIVKMHNTNRGMLFLPIHAGWPNGEPYSKSGLLAAMLPGGRPIPEWYNEAVEVQDESFDVVLALANDYGVRELLAHRNATVLLHATTGRNWLSQLHRHVAGRDDCVACRLGEVKEVAFACSTTQIETPSEERVDAALPFLSGASGLMLATLLQRLQSGVFLDTTANNWRWDFLSEQALAARSGRSKCTETCKSWYAPGARAIANAGTAWAHLDGSFASPRGPHK
jgi:hypothetical protein